MSETNKKQFLKKKIEDFQKGKQRESYNELKGYLVQNPNDSLARYNFGLMAQTLGFVDEAKEQYILTIEKDKKNWQAQFNLYILYIQQKNYNKAILLIDSVLRIKKGFQPALRDKALVLNYLNKPDEAIKYVKESIEINKIDYIAINILGLIYLNMKLYDQAILEFKKAIQINNRYIPSYNNLSTCYSKKFDFKKTEEILLKAISIDSENIETINNIANVYSQKGKYDEAIKFYLKVLNKTEHESDILYNIGVAYYYKKEFEKGEEYYKKAFILDPNNDVLKKNYSLLLLAQQKFKEGWSIYDGRLNLNDFLFKNSTLDNVKRKLWNNQKINKTDKILVVKEQGIGDEILFSSMYPDLLRKYPNCIIETEKRLLQLFKSSFGNEKSFVEYRSVSSDKKKLDNFSYTIYAGSLGKLFRNSLDDFPKKSFLKNSKKLNENTEQLFNKYKDKIKIGISWTSKAAVGEDKSLSLEIIKPILLLANKFEFINMQYHDSSLEIKNFEEKNKTIKINQLAGIDMYNDFDELASALKKLDLFVTVSNSTAHLAASLGVETWIIKPKNHAVFHYWNQPGNSTPWYNSVKLYNYKGDWSITVNEIKKDLEKKFI
tara:strand:+ start:2992 stop:4803 length:1812 start_codon:yes stop_codon:yes gene_type:complete